MSVTRAALLLLPALLAAAAGAQQFQQQGRRRGPPPSALENCRGKEEGAACVFDGPMGEETGQCFQVREGMACVPEHAPRPPKMGQRPQAGPPEAHQGGTEAALNPRGFPPDPDDRPVQPLREMPQLGEARLAETRLKEAAAQLDAASARLDAARALSEPAPAALAPLPAAVAPALLPEAAEPPKDRSFPLGAALGAFGCVAGLLALWKANSSPATQPVSAPVAPPPAAAPAPEPVRAPPESVRTVVADASPKLPTTDIGRLVGRDYVIRRELGAGGMGVVYEAMDVKLDRKVALKKMRSEIGQTARSRERFLEEARMVAKLQHPNVVAIHAVIEEEKDVFLVFEHVDGETLDDLLAREKRLPWEKLASIFQGVASAVDYAHEMRVIHRDLKPANIMIDRHGRAKVMDFGIAHQAKLTISQMTMAEAYGTLAYMPPEQELGQAVRESDVYAFAAVAYESMIGSLPFPGPNFHLQKQSMSFTRPSGTFPPLSGRLDPVFERAFQVEPKKRYPTTSEFALALQGAAGA